MLEEFKNWEEWHKFSEWIILFIATWDARIKDGEVLLHFLHWYAIEQYHLSEKYGDSIKLSRDERHRLIEFIFKKREDGSLNYEIALIANHDPGLYPSTPRSEFVTEQFLNNFRNTKEYAHLFWDK